MDRPQAASARGRHAPRVAASIPMGVALGLGQHPHHPRAHAEAAGLVYVTDDSPGIRRKRAGKGSTFVRPDGARVTDPEELMRIRALVIPPAWTDVWICPDERGHLQATGRDARGRKQYRYHARWRAVRDETKYDRMIRFGALLPRLRARVDEDLARGGMPRHKVLASVVRMLEATHARVGNDEYARTNGSFGLTTILNEHASVRGAKVRLSFRGKSGKMHDVEMEDPRVARIVRKCQTLPGQELFCYRAEDGSIRDVKSEDVNAYIREAMGEDFTAKDFRTWAGTLLAARALRELGPSPSVKLRKRNVTRAIQRVSQKLGNTPAVCRKCYVHPAVIASYLDGELTPVPHRRLAREDGPGLSEDERALLRLLRSRIA